MIIQGTHDTGTADKIFVAMYNGDTASAIVRGSWVDLDETDNSGTPLGKTIGQRVKVCRVTGDVRYANWTVVGCAETAVPVATAGKNGPLVLIQVYGYHDKCLFNNAGIAAHNGTLRPTFNLPGAATAYDINLVPSGEEPEYLAGMCGFSMVTGTGLDAQAAFIQCM